MYPDVTTAMASQTQDELVHRAAAVRRARCARIDGRRPSQHRIGGAFRRWLDAGEL